MHGRNHVVAAVLMGAAPLAGIHHVLKPLVRRGGDGSGARAHFVDDLFGSKNEVFEPGNHVPNDSQPAARNENIIRE